MTKIHISEIAEYANKNENKLNLNPKVQKLVDEYNKKLNTTTKYNISPSENEKYEEINIEAKEGQSEEDFLEDLLKIHKENNRKVNVIGYYLNGNGYNLPANWNLEMEQLLETKRQIEERNNKPQIEINSSNIK